MTKTRILFVDDEPNIYDGIRGQLREKRHDWEIVIVPDAESALGALEHAPFDVLLSDMRMPGMDGAEFLRRVQEAYPGVARIALSGHVHGVEALRARPYSQQFISKPCSAETIRLVIERVRRLQDLLQPDVIRSAIGGADAFLPVPPTYWELVQASANPEIGIPEVIGIVERDPAVAARVLQLANAAHFGLSRTIDSIHDAVVILGIEFLKGLALSAHVFERLEGAPVEGLALEAFRKHSLGSARVARMMWRDPELADAAFTASLVHDIGKIIEAGSIPEVFREISAEVRASGRPFHEVEAEQIGVSHGEIGAYFLGVWGLPLATVEAVAYHHTPSQAENLGTNLLLSVHVSDVLADEILGGDGDPLDAAYLAESGMSAKLPEWREMAARALAS